MKKATKKTTKRTATKRTAKKTTRKPTKKAATKRTKKAPVKKGSRSSDLTGVEIRSLKALRNGKPKTTEQIVKITGKRKGNKLRELTAKGLILTLKIEDQRAYNYQITAKGKKALQSNS